MEGGGSDVSHENNSVPALLYMLAGQLMQLHSLFSRFVCYPAELDDCKVIKG